MWAKIPDGTARKVHLTLTVTWFLGGIAAYFISGLPATISWYISGLLLPKIEIKPTQYIPKE